MFFFLSWDLFWCSEIFGSFWLPKFFFIIWDINMNCLQLVHGTAGDDSNSTRGYCISENAESMKLFVARREGLYRYLSSTLVNWCSDFWFLNSRSTIAGSIRKDRMRNRDGSPRESLSSASTSITVTRRSSLSLFSFIHRLTYINRPFPYKCFSGRFT